MGRKEVLAERRSLEEFYYNCRLETPEEVAKLRPADYHYAGYRRRH